MSIPLAEAGCRVTAIEKLPERVSNIKRTKGSLDITAIAGDLMSHAFEPCAFDYVISRQLVSHFRDWQPLIQRKADLCKPGGAIIFHAHAAECFDLASTIAVSPDRRQDVEAGYGQKRSRISKEDLIAFCTANGLLLEHRWPVSFSMPNGILFRSALDREKIQQFQSEYDRRLELSGEAYEFVRWLDEEIMGRLPVALSTHFMAVLRKPLV